MSTQKALGLVILTFLAFIQLSKQFGGDRAQVILAMYMDYNSISVHDTSTGITYAAKNILCSWNVKLSQVLILISRYNVEATVEMAWWIFIH